MAATSVILDIRANTTRALSEFKRFSAQLDNKFLISGLKLDVVRSALGQINREFQRAIGEQGLASGQSLRAAQNQAALILDTFKNVGIESSVSITEQFSNAFSEIAITAGGSAEDIKKALGASAWISTNLAEDVRKQLAEGVFAFQRDARRAGLGENYAEIIQQFLSGQVTARDLINSGRPLESAIGAALGRTSAAGGTIDEIVSAEQRSRIVAELQNSSQLRSTLQQLIARADWGFTVIEDLNARLFNPERGVFGVLRQVTMAVGDKTTILQETRKLIDSIFGKQGLFVTFFQQVGKIFGIEDPLKVVITGIRWITTQFNRLNEFLQSPEVQNIVKVLEGAFKNIQEFVTKISDAIRTNLEDPESPIRRTGTNISNFFKRLDENIQESLKDPTSLLSRIKAIAESITGFFTSIKETVEEGTWDPTKINQAIRGIGESIRALIGKVGKDIREADVKTQGNFILSIIQTLVEEAAKTLGTAISQIIQTIFSDKGASILVGVVSTLEKALSGFFAGLFGNELIGKILGGAALTGLGILLARRIRSAFMSVLGPVLAEIQRVRTGGGGPLGFANRLLGGTSTAQERTRSPRGSMSVFERAVVTYLRAIQRCVCGGMFGRDEGFDPTDRQSRRDRVRSRRGPTGPGRIPGVDRRIITPVTQYDAPIGPRAPAGVGRFRFDGPLEIQRPRRDLRTRMTEYGRRFALPLSETPVPGWLSRSDDNVAARFNRRYGSGGTRAVLGRGFRGFGKGALIAGGVTALGAGAMGLFGGSSAQASQFDPETGEPIMTPGQKQLSGVGNVLGGGLEGAMLGATIGSVVPGVGTAAGAVVGGVIGGVIPLFDKGTREGVSDFVSGIDKSFKEAGDSIADSADNAVKWISEGFSSLGTSFSSSVNRALSSIDWKTVLINALIPGGSMTIQGLQGIAEFASKLDVFGAIKSGIDSISGFTKSIWDRISNWRWPWQSQNNNGGNYQGVNYFGPTLRQESLMSGANARVVNDREFVIPRDGFHILADAVARKSSKPETQSASNVSANFNVTINVNGGLNNGNTEELRASIISIIDDAWQQATTGVSTRGSIV